MAKYECFYDRTDNEIVVECRARKFKDKDFICHKCGGWCRRDVEVTIENSEEDCPDRATVLVNSGEDGCSMWWHGVCRYENKDMEESTPCPNCKKWVWKKYYKVDGKMIEMEWRFKALPKYSKGTIQKTLFDY